MADRTSASYTPPYPSYLNITIAGEQVAVTLRSAANADGSMGTAATITFPLVSFRELLADLGADLVKQ